MLIEGVIFTTNSHMNTSLATKAPGTYKLLQQPVTLRLQNLQECITGQPIETWNTTTIAPMTINANFNLVWFSQIVCHKMCCTLHSDSPILNFKPSLISNLGLNPLRFQNLTDQMLTPTTTSKQPTISIPILQSQRSSISTLLKSLNIISPQVRPKLIKIKLLQSTY